MWLHHIEIHMMFRSLKSDRPFSIVGYSNHVTLEQVFIDHSQLIKYGMNSFSSLSTYDVLRTPRLVSSASLTLYTDGIPTYQRLHLHGIFNFRRSSPGNQARDSDVSQSQSQKSRWHAPRLFPHLALTPTIVQKI